MKLYIAVLLVILHENHALTIKEKLSNRIDSLVDKYFEDRKNDHKQPKLISEQHCVAAGVGCVSCTECYPGGWCLIDEAGLMTKQCICNYGRTGKGAFYKPDTTSPAWGRNRIIAWDCLTGCLYTHEKKNEKCVETRKEPASNTVPTPPSNAPKDSETTLEGIDIYDHFPRFKLDEINPDEDLGPDYVSTNTRNNDEELPPLPRVVWPDDLSNDEYHPLVGDEITRNDVPLNKELEKERISEIVKDALDKLFIEE